eukprot:6488830-Amphidinium_carterae.2
MARAARSVTHAASLQADMAASSTTLMSQWSASEPARKGRASMSVWDKDRKRRASNRELIVALEHQLRSVGLSWQSFKGSWHGVRLTQTADILHRTHNNWTMALSSSGLGGVRAELRHLLAVRNGPFRSGGTHALLLEAATLMEQGECWRHALWHHMYPQVACDLGHSEDSDFGSEEHSRSIFLKMSAALKCAGKHQIRLSRWFCVEARGERIMQEHGLASLLYLFLWVGWWKSWWRRWDDCPLSQSDVSANLKVSEHEEIADLAEVGPLEVETAVEDGTRAEPTHGDINVDKLKTRGKVNVTIYHACRLLCDPMAQRLYKLIVLLPTALRVWFNDVSGLVKSPRGCEEMVVRMARGSLLSALRDLTAGFGSADLAEALGFTHREVVDEDVQREDTQVAKSAYSLWLHSVSEMSTLLTSAEFEPPYVFSRLVVRDETIKAAAMEHLRQVWDALKCLEKADSKKDAAKVSFVRDLRWPRNQFVREVFHTLESWSWTVPHFLEHVLAEWSQSWWSTVIAENSLREGRKAELAPSGRGGILKSWVSMNSSPSLAPEYGRHPVSSKKQMPNAPIINDTFFEVDGSVSSIRDAELDVLLESSVEFPTTSSTETREVALRTCCLRHFAGKWAEMSETWQSRLLEPGDVVSHTHGSKKVYLVVRASTWGAVGYPLSVLGLSSNNVVQQLVKEDSRYEYFA